jgi:hypothetical protein
LIPCLKRLTGLDRYNLIIRVQLNLSTDIQHDRVSRPTPPDIEDNNPGTCQNYKPYPKQPSLKYVFKVFHDIIPPTVTLEHKF